MYDQVSVLTLNFVAEMEVFRADRREKTVGIPQGAVGNRMEGAADVPSRSSREIRARKWLASRPPAVAGQGGRKHTARAAVALLLDFDLDFVTTERLLSQDNLRYDPPWSPDQLHQIIVWADGRPGERGSKLRQTRGAHCKPGQEDLAWLDHIQYDLRGTAFTTHYDGAGSVTLLPPGREPLFTQAEWDSFGPGPTIVARVGPADDDDEDLDEDDDHGTPLEDEEDGADLPQIVDPEDHAHHPHHALADGSAPRCTCSFLVALHRPSTHQLRWLRLPGRRWDCSPCCERRREHYRATIRHWLLDWATETDGEDAPNLWIATVPEALWKKVSSSIRIKRGSFFKIDHSAMGSIRGHTYLAVSTIKTRHCEWEPISPRAATERLVAAIEAVRTDTRVRIWWSSRTWRLLPDRPEKDPEWTRLGRVSHSWRTIADVLEAWDITTRAVRGVGRFWSFSGHQATYREDQWDNLKADLDAGSPVSKLELQIGGNPLQPTAGWDGASLTDDWT